MKYKHDALNDWLKEHVFIQFSELKSQQTQHILQRFTSSLLKVKDKDISQTTNGIES